MVKTFAAGCATAASGAQRRPKARMMRSPIRERFMVASQVHGRVRAFYALRAGEENQILHH
jgi:hypothetical protein